MLYRTKYFEEFMQNVKENGSYQDLKIKSFKNAICGIDLKILF